MEGGVGGWGWSIDLVVCRTLCISQRKIIKHLEATEKVLPQLHALGNHRLTQAEAIVDLRPRDVREKSVKRKGVVLCDTHRNSGPKSIQYCAVIISVIF